MQYEMQWTVRYFLNEANKWKVRSHIVDLSPGAKAYAARQAATWNGHAVTADKDFGLTNRNHVTLI